MGVKEAKGKKVSKKSTKTDSTVDIAKDIGRKDKAEKKKDEVKRVVESKPDLPSIDTDQELKKIAEESKKVEANFVKKQKKSKVEKVDENDKEAFLSVSDQTKDGEIPRVPSYSAKKNRGVVYISHIPHGFYEKQMRDFFAQFGSVTNLRLGRSSKTGKSRGYAFVEFKFKEVATIVAESMNNYLMFDKILKCSIVAEERVSGAMFRNKINPNKPPKVTARRKAKKLHNAVKCEETEPKRIKRTVLRTSKSLKKLKAAGIDYKFQIYQ